MVPIVTVDRLKVGDGKPGQHLQANDELLSRCGARRERQVWRMADGRREAVNGARYSFRSDLGVYLVNDQLARQGAGGARGHAVLQRVSCHYRRAVFFLLLPFFGGMQLVAIDAPIMLALVVSV